MQPTPRDPDLSLTQSRILIRDFDARLSRLEQKKKKKKSKKKKKKSSKCGVLLLHESPRDQHLFP